MSHSAIANETGKMPYITVTHEIYGTLESLAEHRGMAVEELLAEAIGLEITFSDAQDKGYKLLLEKNGKLRRLG
jgi:hypothetical protein